MTTLALVAGMIPLAVGVDDLAQARLRQPPPLPATNQAEQSQVPPNPNKINHFFQS